MVRLVYYISCKNIKINCKNIITYIIWKLYYIEINTKLIWVSSWYHKRLNLGHKNIGITKQTGSLRDKGAPGEDQNRFLQKHLWPITDGLCWTFVPWSSRNDYRQPELPTHDPHAWIGESVSAVSRILTVLSIETEISSSNHVIWLRVA